MSDELPELRLINVDDGEIVDLTSFLPKKVKREKDEHLYPPGTLGNLVEHYYQRMPRKNRAVALGAVLAGISAACQNKYVCRVLPTKDTPLNLYVVNALKTGGGKESGNDIISSICKLSGCTVASDVTSGPALHKLLASVNGGKSADYASACISIDELGLFLSVARAQNQSAKATFLAMLLQLFGRAQGTLDARFTADIKTSLPAINCPYVVLYGTSTPSTLTAGLKPENVDDGTLNRLLVLDDEEDSYEAPTIMRRGSAAKRLPPHLPITLQKAIKLLPNGVKRPAADPNDPATVLEPGAIYPNSEWQDTQLQVLHRDFHGPASSNKDTVDEALGRRLFELIVRVAGVQAALEAAHKAAEHGQTQINEDDLNITDEQLDWARTFVMNSFNRLKYLVDKMHEGDDRLQKVCIRIRNAYDRVLKHMQEEKLIKPGHIQVPKREVMQKVKGGAQNPRELQDAVIFLRDTTKELVEVTIKTERNQDAILWHFRDFAEDDVNL